MSIKNSLMRQTLIHKRALHAELRTKESSHSFSILQLNECRKSMDQFYYRKIYGEDTLATKRKFPGTPSQIAFDPLYVVVDYKPVITDLNNKQRIGEDALIACLNPNASIGHRSAINQYTPILKSTPNMENNQQPLEELKFKVCKRFVRF